MGSVLVTKGCVRNSPQTGGFDNKGLWCLHESGLFHLYLHVPMTLHSAGAWSRGLPPKPGIWCWVWPRGTFFCSLRSPILAG